MSKPTPGPWHRNIRANGKYSTVFAGRNQHVAVASQQSNSEETEANIDLIAAAPELFDALRVMLLTSRQIKNGQVSAAKAKAEDLARAALAKVQGGAA